jgi:hypothetical protein
MTRSLVVLLCLVACTPREEIQPSRPQPVAVKITVEPAKVISDGEDLRALRIASPLAPDHRELDVVCVIYRNEAMKTAQLVCPEGVPDLSHLSED